MSFTLVLCDWGDLFSRRGKTEDPSTIDAPFRLYVVLKWAVYSSKQTGHILGLKYQLEEGSKAE